MKEENDYKPKAHEIYELFNKQDYRCFVTGNKFTKKNVDIGHIIPMSKGGKHEFENLCLFDKAFTGLKRYYTVDEIKEILKEVFTHEQK
ncbi:hypothetical protein LPTSP2_38840 [Leptospira ellinghausenii]|uniref:HNH endonuclease n=1 Tax=Leptospira ellinghausenii TaxID=1917822 RepID=A0A2P2DJ29_9LEPT|nr:HNH endonuclease signature motif containing protein [Leptospira ellinghausenii]GBF44581.1 hypothetical protein LPTSP2_38840 [Leptospira ellinghausenii]